MLDPLVRFPPPQFARAFDETVGREGSLPLTRVDDVLRRVFHGPVPAPEQKKVAAHFAERFGAGGAAGLASTAATLLSRDAFLEAISELRAIEAATPLDMSASAHYQSSEMLREHRLKAVRPEVGPEGIYKQSLTAFNEIGWRGYEKPVGYVRHPKKQCEETKFLGELAKAGLI